MFSPSAARSMHAQRPADEPTDFLSTPAKPASHRLAIRAAVGGRRQHGVLRGEPPQTGCFTPPGHPFGDAGGAQDLGVTEFDETDPAGFSVKPRVMITGRSSWSSRPSSRLDTTPTLDLAGSPDFERLVAYHRVHRAVELGLGLADDVLTRSPRRDMRQQQLTNAGLRGNHTGFGARQV